MLGALGWWLPWVTPQSGAAALVLLGLDLGDFWKFTQPWRSGQFEAERLFFFLPPALAALCLLLWLSGERGALRWGLLPLLFFCALVVLPALDILLPAMMWLPPRLATPSLAREFAFQLYLSLGVLASIALLPLWGRLGTRGRYGLIGLIALAGACLPAWALWRTWPLLQGLYAGGAQVGVGVGVTSGGFVLAALAALGRVRRA